MLLEKLYRTPRELAPRTIPVRSSVARRVLTAIGVWCLASLAGGVLGGCVLGVALEPPGGGVFSTSGVLILTLALCLPIWPLLQLITPLAVWKFGAHWGLPLWPLAILLALGLAIALLSGTTWVLHGDRGARRRFGIAVAVTSLALPISLGLVLS